MSNMRATLLSHDGSQRLVVNTDQAGRGVASFGDNPGVVTVIVQPTNDLLGLYWSCPPTQLANYQTEVGPYVSPPSGLVMINMGRISESVAWGTLNASVARLKSENFAMTHVNVCISKDGDGNAWLPREGYLRLNASDVTYPDIVNHEYGHAVMQAAAKQIVTTQRCNPHGMKRATNPSCAWVEGWASFFAIYARFPRDAANPVIFNGDSMEAYSSSVFGRDGYSDEGRVAAALWDLYDTHDDSSTDPTYGQSNYSDSNSGSPINMSWMLQSMNGADVDSSSGTIRTYVSRLLQNPNVSQKASTAATSIMSYNWVARVTGPAADEESPQVRKAARRSR